MRPFLRAVLVGVLVVAFQAGAPGCSEALATPERPPNVVVIVTDDQRADDTLEVMPATRRLLAEEGTTFTEAFAPTPVCCPSRASIFTGRYAHNHGVRRGHDRDALDHLTTMQAGLQSAGYRTGIFGKYLNGWDLSRDPPFFDEWAVFSRGVPGGYSGGTWNVDGRVRTVHQYSTSYIEDRARRFVAAAGDRPWFLYLAPFAPHPPAIPEPRYQNASVPGGASGLHARRLRTLMSVDDLVRSVLAVAGDDTMAVFLSDNGFLLGEHGLTGKAQPYTPAVKIPLLLRGPGRVPAGRTDDRMAATIDVAPTVLDAAGAVPAIAPDGRSLLRPWTRDRLVLSMWSGAPGRPELRWASLRTPTEQYIEREARTCGDGPMTEYYDLRADPGQLRDLLADRVPGNDPPGLDALDRLPQRDLRCSGTTGSRACP